MSDPYADLKKCIPALKEIDEGLFPPPKVQTAIVDAKRHCNLIDYKLSAGANDSAGRAKYASDTLKMMKKAKDEVGDLPEKERKAYLKAVDEIEKATDLAESNANSAWKLYSKNLTTASEAKKSFSDAEERLVKRKQAAEKKDEKLAGVAEGVVGIKKDIDQADERSQKAGDYNKSISIILKGLSLGKNQKTLAAVKKRY